MEGLEEKQIIIRDVLLTYFIRLGPKDTDTLVFLHGWGSRSSLWFNIFIPLQKKYSLVFIDLPGFGKSEEPKEIYGIHQYTQTVLECLGKIGIKQAILVGHSFGGSIALSLAHTFPKTVRALILAGSAGIRPKTINKSLIQTIAGFMHPVFKPKFMQPLRRVIYNFLGSPEYTDTTPVMKQIYQQVISEDLTPILPNITQSALLIWGQNDKETPLHNGELMHKLLTNSTLEIIPGAGHFSFLDKKEQFLKIIHNFL